MSKKGGTSEINGFISLGSDDKKAAKKKDENIPKRGIDEAVQRRRDHIKDSSQSTTQNRTRLSHGKSKKDFSNIVEKKEAKSNSTRVRNEVTLSKKTESKHSTKEGTLSSNLIKTRKPVSTSEKHSIASRDVQKSHSESTTKPKEHVSSPYISSRSTKPKIVQSSPQQKKQSSLLSKDSPYRSTLAQKTQPQTSSKAFGDRLRKTSQLVETSTRSKASTAIKTASKTSKHTVPETKTSSKKSSSSKSKSTVSKQRKNSISEVVDRITEEHEKELQLRPFGEIPRSNTFTKEGAAPDSLTSDLSVSQAQEYESYSSINQTEQLDEYNYDDDFEDYASDFEDYMESEGSSTETEEEEESSGTDHLDEDEHGDGFKVSSSLSHARYTEPEKPQKKSILKQQTILTNESNKENLNEKEKPLTVEEERKLDSGSYDLTSHADLRRKKQIQDIRAAMDKENANLTAQMGHQKVRSFAEDEGFVEVFSQETSPTFLDTSQSPSQGLINFAHARKQQIKQKAKAKVKKRGALLMEMIRLDVMSFNLLDIPSVPYEVYMKCYGRSNTFQIHTQTNEDSISEEVQTDEITSTSKWTQHPVKYSSPKSPDDLLFTISQEKLGVGGESTLNENVDWMPKLHVNSLKIHNFINSAGEMILALLEEYEQDRHLEISKTTNKRDFGFSESFTSLNVGKVDFLKGRAVSIVCFSESNSSHILTVHRPSTEPLTIQAESESRCMLCTWSVREPSSPLQTLVASNDVTSVCFHSYLVFAGLIDGAICLWDLREQSAIHCRSFLKLPTWLLRSPTYISADLERNKRHLSSVMSIKILPESNPDDSVKTTSEQTPTQVVSLDEDGLLITWAIVETKSTVNIDSGLAPWGKVRLIQSSQLRVLKAFPKPVQSVLQCRCLAVDSLKPSNLYIGTNSGEVAHCLQSSTRARPQLYAANKDTNTSTTCMDFSRTGHSLLMVGDSAGRVQIYRTMTERPLLDIAASASVPGPPVKCLQWSPAQPGLFFVLDANSCIHVWDLCTSDMCPLMSVPFSSQVITSISLTTHPHSRMLAIASEAGTVDIYNLKAEFGALPEKDSNEQQHIFTRYITLL